MNTSNAKNTNENLDVNFNHRLSVVNQTTKGGLMDSINLMAERASSVLYILSGQFTGVEDNRWSDAIVSGAIDSAIQEIEDMKKTVNAFYKHNRKDTPEESKPAGASSDNS